jgi:hypothetical protein
LSVDRRIVIRTLLLTSAALYRLVSPQRVLGRTPRPQADKSARHRALDRQPGPTTFVALERSTPVVDVLYR